MDQPTSIQEDDLSDWKEQLQLLWIRVLLAVNRAVALGITLLIHKGLDWAIRWILPIGWERTLTLLQAVFAVIFSIIYLHFLWEMLVTFVPSVKGLTRKTGAGDANAKDDKQGNLF